MNPGISLRTRMMLLFCTVAGLLLVVSYFVLYFVVARTVHEEFDGRLLETATTLSEDLVTRIATPDDISEVGTPGEAFELLDEHGKRVAFSRSLHKYPLPAKLEQPSDLTRGPWTVDLPEQGRVRGITIPVRTASIAGLDTWSAHVKQSSGGTLTVCNFRVSRGNPGTNEGPSVTVTKISPASSCVTAPDDGSWHGATLPAAQAGTFTATYDATPSMLMRAAVGISQGEQIDYVGFATTVAFTRSGTIEVLDGKSYRGAIPYLAGQTYHFRLVVDIPSHIYSVFVTPPGGTEQTIGSNFAFRSAQNQGNRSWTLAVAMSTSQADASLLKLRKTIFFLLISSLTVVTLISASYAQRSLRPLSDLTEKISFIAQHLRERSSSLKSLGRDSSLGFCEDLCTRLPVRNSQDELGRLTRAFNQLSATLDDVLQQMQQFVSDASHELRTPLSVLRGETELLLSKPRSTEEYEQVLSVINVELQNLTRIVEGLFTLAMADAGQLLIAKESLCLNDVLDEACALMKQKALAKSIAIQRENFEEIHSIGDETLLRQLFLIFLDNALKYSPPHTSIRVDLKAEADLALIRFEDQGIGIAPEQLPHIFERFYRGPLSGNGDSQSGGLGLAIAKAIAKIHNGTIECASILGKGSTFAIKLFRNVANGASHQFL